MKRTIQTEITLKEAETALLILLDKPLNSDHLRAFDTLYYIHSTRVCFLHKD